MGHLKLTNEPIVTSASFPEPLPMTKSKSVMPSMQQNNVFQDKDESCFNDDQSMAKSYLSHSIMGLKKS